MSENTRQEDPVAERQERRTRRGRAPRSACTRCSRRCRLGSRRALEERIAQGVVKVNWRSRPHRHVGGQRRPHRTRRPHLRRHRADRTEQRAGSTTRPEGTGHTREDTEGRPTIFESLPRLKGARWIAVAAWTSTPPAWLLLTTDGELAHALMPPIERDRARVRLPHPRDEVPDNIVDRLGARRGAGGRPGPSSRRSSASQCQRLAFLWGRSRSSMAPRTRRSQPARGGGPWGPVRESQGYSGQCGRRSSSAVRAERQITDLGPHSLLQACWTRSVAVDVEVPWEEGESKGCQGSPVRGPGERACRYIMGLGVLEETVSRMIYGIGGFARPYAHGDHASWQCGHPERRMNQCCVFVERSLTSQHRKQRRTAPVLRDATGARKAGAGRPTVFIGVVASRAGILPRPTRQGRGAGGRNRRRALCTYGSADRINGFAPSSVSRGAE
jgi:hypothetical protein